MVILKTNPAIGNRLFQRVKVEQSTKHKWTKGLGGGGKGVVYLTSPGCPTDIGLQLGKACGP